MDRHGENLYGSIWGWAFLPSPTALPENVSIPHFAEKFGLTFEGTLRERNFERGRRVDLLLWSLLEEERLAGRQPD